MWYLTDVHLLRACRRLALELNLDPRALVAFQMSHLIE